MLTLRDIKDLLVHYEDNELNEWEVTLWDVEHQQPLQLGGGFSSDNVNKKISVPVFVPVPDDEKINNKLKKLISKTLWAETATITPKSAPEVYFTCYTDKDNNKYYSTDTWNGVSWESDVTPIAWKKIIPYKDNDE